MNIQNTGESIRNLRIQSGLTQKQLAEKMNISDKTVSKWERGIGYPDVSSLPLLSQILGVDIQKLLSGGLKENSFVAGKIKDTKYYVCPICGNISICTGNAEIYCCSRKLIESIPQKSDNLHDLNVGVAEDEWFITANHPMLKDHYISFIAFICDDRLQFVKQYPEWTIETRFPIRAHGRLLWYCTKHGLFYKDV